MTDSEGVMAAPPCVCRDTEVGNWPIAPVYYSKILNYTLTLKMYGSFLNSIGSATVADIVYKCFLTAVAVSLRELKLCWV